MPDWAGYRHGVHRVSESVYAYLVPDGSWSLNNTAFVASGNDALVVDTTVDLPSTRRMLAAMAAADERAAHFGTVFLTHWHIDHVHGVCAPELARSRVVASRRCADYMAALPPQKWLDMVASLTGDAKKTMDNLIGDRFDFSGLTYRAPTDIFEGKTTLPVGSLDVLAEELKPGHTLSDSIVFVPAEGVVHMGDIIILPGRHLHLQYPMLQNLIDNCDTFLGMDAGVFIPGHGPLMNKADIAEYRDYCKFLQQEARARFDKGMTSDQAADDLLRNLGAYRSLGHPQALYFTTEMIFSEIAGDHANYARRNYPEYLAKQWRLKQTLPGRFPELFKAA